MLPWLPRRAALGTKVARGLRAGVLFFPSDMVLRHLAFAPARMPSTAHSCSGCRRTHAVPLKCGRYDPCERRNAPVSDDRYRRLRDDRLFAGRRTEEARISRSNRRLRAAGKESRDGPGTKAG